MCNRAEGKEELEQLRDRILRGIDEAGVHVLAAEDLTLIRGAHGDVSPLEKRMHLENYASYHGLALHLNEDATIVVFRRSNG